MVGSTRLLNIRRVGAGVTATGNAARLRRSSLGQQDKTKHVEGLLTKSWRTLARSPGLLWALTQHPGQRWTSLRWRWVRAPRHSEGIRRKTKAQTQLDQQSRSPSLFPPFSWLLGVVIVLYSSYHRLASVSLVRTALANQRPQPREGQGEETWIRLQWEHQSRLPASFSLFN